jgi:citrate-Mg2+:H+ or citrate-Ca2+:H+ symporter, CitMHS family
VTLSLAALGFLTIGCFLLLTLFTRIPVIAALVLVPLVAALIGGFAGDLGSFATDGIKTVANVAAMIMFAILFFGLMLDKGLFEPMIVRVMAIIKDDPVRLCVASAALPMLVALDGDGATTFLISVTALLPVHRRLGVNPLVLPCIVALSAGVMNMLPWGGPTARAMTVLNAGIDEIFVPVLPAMIAGLIWVLGVAWWLGRKEALRLGPVKTTLPPACASEPELPNPTLFGFNLCLTLLVVLLLFRDLYASLLPLPAMPAPLVFLAAFAIALPVNCRTQQEQTDLFANHGGTIAQVVGMVMAAGIFTGVLNGSGMTKAMAEALASNMPQSFGPWFSGIVAVASMPLSLVLPPDAYYFGVLPVFAETAAAMGQDPLTIGRASIMGQMTTGFPLSPLTASTFVLLGLTGISLRDHQRFTFKWAFGTTAVMAFVGLLTGAIG